MTSNLKIRGWDYLCPRSKDERREAIDQYAKLFIEPAFNNFPELFGKVYLAIRKNGFFAFPTPVYNIIIPADYMQKYDIYRLRFIAAHELLHLIQFLHGIKDDRWNVVHIERQATFMSFSRGFALDFINAFPASCLKEECDMKGRFCYYNCTHIFQKCCKEYTNSERDELANRLYQVSSQFEISDNIDYLTILRKELHT